MQRRSSCQYSLSQAIRCQGLHGNFIWMTGMQSLPASLQWHSLTACRELILCRNERN